MGKDKLFVIKSKLNGLVLDVKAGDRDAGTKVITWPQKPGFQDNQLWYQDRVTGTIRSQLTNLCLDIDDDNHLVLNEFEEGRENQRWRRDKDEIINRDEQEDVLDIARGEADRGAEICRWKKHGGDNQKWEFEHVEPRFFYIRAHNGKVLDLRRNQVDPGTKVVVCDKEDGQDTQLWYENHLGIVCPKLSNNLVLDSSHPKVKLQEYDRESRDQGWTLHRNKIVKQYHRDSVIDIREERKEHKNAKLCCKDCDDSDSQCWHVDYV